MLRLLHSPDSLGQFSGSVAEPVAAPKLSPVPSGKIEKAPRWWRIKNRARMLLSGELFIPLMPKITAAARSNLVRRIPILGKMIAGSLGSLSVTWATLYGVVTHADGSKTDYGVLGYHLVVTAGKNFIASAFDNTVELEILKYHGFGTGSTSPAVGDTALVTELTTQYAVSNTRPTGSQGHSTNTYTTVATLAPVSNVAIQEWGLFSQASNAGGTLLDRQVFSVVNLVANADTLATTYVFTVS